MDRITSKELMASPKRITRSQAAQHRSVFPFLQLPGEMRNWVYQFAVGDLEGFAEFLDKFYKEYLRRKVAGTWINQTRNRRMESPSEKMKAPNILFINKQITQEAIGMFYSLNKSVNFNHGLLEIMHIHECISPHILQNLSAINITDSGHGGIIQLRVPGRTDALPASWNGYIRLISQMAPLLTTPVGHKLKNFTIDFSNDKRLAEHMTTCLTATHVCGFKDQMLAALNTLRSVRGVGCVTLRGLNPAHSHQLKMRMESLPTVFADLPISIRNRIYGEALRGWGDEISGAITQGIAGWKNKTKSFPYPILSTPKVLLMGPQYGVEAMQVFQNIKESLTITIPVGYRSSLNGPKMFLSKFIGRKTLKAVRTIVIKTNSRDALKCIDRHFISALSASDAKLENFTLSFRDDVRSRSSQAQPHAFIHEALKDLATIRGLVRVEFSGNLPLCYTGPLGAIMTTRSKTNMPKPKVISNGRLVDADTHQPAY